MLIMMKTGKGLHYITILSIRRGGSDLGEPLHFTKSSESLSIVFPKMNNNEFYWKVM